MVTWLRSSSAPSASSMQMASKLADESKSLATARPGGSPPSAPVPCCCAMPEAMAWRGRGEGTATAES